MIKKWSFLLTAAFFISLLLCPSVFAVCACTLDNSCISTDTWIAQWTDSFGQTTYRLEAPCKVYIGQPFDITASVNDATYPNSNVGFGGAIKDEGSVIFGGGFNWITTASGQWQTTISQTYTGTPINHRIEFAFSDLGQGSGAHSWAANLVGETTVDPYPPSSYLVKLISGGVNADYDMSPADAYAKVSGDGQIIQCKTGEFGELIFALPYAVEFEGGYNSDFSSNLDSFSTIIGYVALTNGTVIMSNINIQ